MSQKITRESFLKSLEKFADKKISKTKKYVESLNQFAAESNVTKIVESQESIDKMKQDSIAFLESDYDFGDYESETQVKIEESRRILQDRYSVGNLILFSHFPLETKKSYQRVNVRFYVTSHDRESQTFAGNATIFSLTGELLGNKTLVLTYKADKYYTKNYDTIAPKPLLKPETRTIPKLAYIIDSYVPLKNGKRPKSVIVMNYWQNLLACNLAALERESKRKERFSKTQYTKMIAKTLTPKSDFKHVVQRTESTFEIVSYQNKSVDMSTRIDSDTRKKTSELPKTVRSLFSFVSIIDSESEFKHDKTQIESAKKEIQALAKKNVFSNKIETYNVYIGESLLVIRHNPSLTVKLAKLQ